MTRDIQTPSKQMKRCSSSTTMREVQIKITRYCLISARMVTIKKTLQSQPVLARMWKTWKLYTAGGKQKGATAMENIMDVPQKTQKYKCHRIQQSHFWVYIQDEILRVNLSFF